LNKLNALFKPYISILFLSEIKAGFLLFFVSFLLPSVGILGLVGLISTILFAEIISVREEYLKQGFYLYNSLLVGMGVGYFFDVTLVTIFLTTILSVFSFLLSFTLNRMFINYSMPILSLPFAFVSMIFYLASLKYTNLLSNILHRKPLFDISIPLLDPFFKSMGTILFLPYTIAGVVLSLVVLFYSRILFLAGFLGFWIGVYLHSFFIPLNEALNSPYNFNFILISMALSGVFLLPHLKNFLLSLLAIVVATIMIDAMEVFFTIYSIPVYTLPFNIITLLFLMLLYGIGYNYYNYNVKETPEKSLESFLSLVYRFGGNDIKINLPFTGRWSVYQAFDGEWTHKGKWKYAYDFVIKKNGKTYQNDGTMLEDYYAFGKPVISPINGYVVALRNDLPDNFIGNVDRVNNWGNYIIIKSNYGYFVEISHLMQNSINVKVGDYIRVGDIIGKCGNSGYSPEPHIHIQVQKFAVLGSETISFKFLDYIKDDKLYYYSLPKKDEEIESAIVDKAMKLRHTFILDDEYRYKVYKNSEKVDEVSFKVKMNQKGEFYFCDGKNQLFFYLDEKLFYFYDYKGGESYLKNLFKLAPKIPLVNKNITYNDILPIYLRYKGINKILFEFFVTFNFKFFDKKEEYKKENLSIYSKYGNIVYSFYEKGFDKIILKDIELRRVYEENSFAN
jgi:urea transporter/murein DD-endopeptidase MepM/ murein hydrolase activator NlpD